MQSRTTRTNSSKFYEHLASSSTTCHRRMRGIWSLILLAECLGFLGLFGCLVTDPLAESVSKTAQENRFPHIVESSVLPKNWQPIRIRNVPCSQELAIQVVVDEDIGDDLTAYWYLDKDPERSAPDAEESIILSGRSERIGPRWTPKDLALGIHVVKVIIRDGSDPMSATSYSWILVCGGEG